MVKTFESRVAELQDSMNSFAYQLTSNRDDALDLSQETILRALNNRDKFNEGTNLKAWLFTIMKNTFINNYRKHVRSAIIDNTYDYYQMNLEQESSLSTPEGVYSLNEITNIVQTFSDEYKIPFTMFIRGYKYTEIAKYMKIPVGTVKSRVFIARKRLQNILKDYKN